MFHGLCNNVATIRRSNSYMKDVSDLFTMTNTLLTKNFYKKGDQFLFIIKIFKTLFERSITLYPEDRKIYPYEIMW